MTDPRGIELLVVLFFLNSSDFNGLPLTALLRTLGDKPSVREALVGSVRSQRVSCAFSSISSNPHIKRFPDLPVEQQVTQLAAEPASGVCLYPCANLVREHTDVSAFNDRPFTKKLLLGAAQLDWAGFDLAVLERYQNDPRYHFKFYDHSGLLSIGDSANEDNRMPERDKVLLQTFGVGYGDENIRLAVVFLRYLKDLSPEHQQYWNSFLYSGTVKIHPEYYRSSYLGEFPEYTSYFGATLAEMKLINELTEGVYGVGLFREIYDDERPSGFTPFFRPTLKSFSDFILAMDKLLSENLNYDFFRGQVPLETEKLREDGKVVVERRSTIALFEEWLRTKIIWQNESDAIDVIIEPLKRVRRLRQAPAHKLVENEYSKEYDEQQHIIFRDVYVSLLNFRATLAGHPEAPAISVPRYLSEGKIAFV
jgi:hypothetical protein